MLVLQDILKVKNLSGLTDEEVFCTYACYALAVQKMIESGLTPEMVVQYKTVDQLTGIAEASAQMFEHVHLGQVTVYGNENTAGNFMAKTAENLNPAFDLLRSIPFADTLKSVLGKKELEEKKAETTEFEEVK